MGRARRRELHRQATGGLIFIIPPVLGGTLQKHHRRRLAILAAKGKLAETKSQALSAPPEPQPICGCSHHLSFHNPQHLGLRRR